MSEKTGRNDPCPCGSGKKFKKCCQDKFEPSLTSPNVPTKGSLPPPVECNQLIALFNAGRHVELESRARLLTDQYPNSGFAWKILGATLSAQGKDALSAMRMVTKLLPDDVEAHVNLGNVLHSLELLDDAVASYRLALKIKQNSAEAHNNLGAALKDLGQLDNAVACYRRALYIKNLSVNNVFI